MSGFLWFQSPPASTDSPGSSIVLNISPTSGPVGTVVTLLTSSSGFTPGTEYAFCFNPDSSHSNTCFSGGPDGTFVADAGGNIPSGVTGLIVVPGYQWLVICNTVDCHTGTPPAYADFSCFYSTKTMTVTTTEIVTSTTTAPTTTTVTSTVVTPTTTTKTATVTTASPTTTTITATQTQTETSPTTVTATIATPTTATVTAIVTQTETSPTTITTTVATPTTTTETATVTTAAPTTATVTAIVTQTETSPTTITTTVATPTTTTETATVTTAAPTTTTATETQTETSPTTVTSTAVTTTTATVTSTTTALTTATVTTTTATPTTTTETATVTTAAPTTTTATETRTEISPTTVTSTIATPTTTTKTATITTATPTIVTTTVTTTILPRTVTVTVTLTTTVTVPSFPQAPTQQTGGSTFVDPVMQAWAKGVAQYTNQTVVINYQPMGSSAGITGILKSGFEFAGSDAPLTISQWQPYSATTGDKGPLLQIPETLGGVAIFYNIPGVTVSLNLTGPILAKIYLGEIKMWNDPAIQALNPGCHAGSTTCVLPADTIQPVYRSDGSGTTYALTNYFEKVSTDWNASFTGGCPCYGTSIGWPSSEIGANGSSGVAAYVENNPYTVGYADSYYALANGLKAAAIQNQAGVFLVPTLTDIAAAANAFSTQVQANPTFTITDAPGAGSYPISTFTYLLVWANQKNQQQGYDTVQFFEWIVNQGQAIGPGLNYPALPAYVIPIDQALIQKINYNNAPFITASTTVSCNHASVTVGSAATCKATVVGSGSLPTGSVTWSSSGSGKFSKQTCKLSKGACSVKFTPAAAGSSVLLTATYEGNIRNVPSAGTYSLTVSAKGSKTTVSCTPKSTAVGSVITCTAKVKGYAPTGTISWFQSGTGSVSFSSTTCALSKGSVLRDDDSDD